MGHIFTETQTYQVIDTPGLLDRGNDNNEDRNEMEMLTLASLMVSYLRCIFVFPYLDFFPFLFAGFTFTQ